MTPELKSCEWRPDPKRDHTMQFIAHGVVTGRISYSDGQWHYAVYDGMWTIDAGVSPSSDQAMTAVENSLRGVAF